jgi:ferredoxin
LVDVYGVVIPVVGLAALFLVLLLWRWDTRVQRQPFDTPQRLRLQIDWNSCMGAASCVSLAPTVFKLDDAALKSVFIGRAPLILLDEQSVDNETIFRAAQSCPYRAIHLIDADTATRFYP